MKKAISLLAVAVLSSISAEEMPPKLSTKSSKTAKSSENTSGNTKSGKAYTDTKAQKVSPANTSTPTLITTTNTGSFVWFTDVHYDEYYGTTQAAFHGGKHPSCPGYEENHCNNTNSPKFSIYGCGASKGLVESFLSEAARVTNGSPDFVMFSGDATRHFADGLKESAKSTVHNAITYLYNATKEHFPNIPVYQYQRLFRVTMIGVLTTLSTLRATNHVLLVRMVSHLWQQMSIYRLLQRTMKKSLQTRWKRKFLPAGDIPVVRLSKT